MGHGKEEEFFNLGLEPGYWEAEHRHLAKAMASFKAAPQHPDQLSFRRFDLLEVSRVQRPWWQAKKELWRKWAGSIELSQRL